MLPQSILKHVHYYIKEEEVCSCVDIILTNIILYFIVQVALVSWGSKSMCQKGGKVESDSESRDFHINLFKVLPFLKSVLAKDTDDYVPLEFIKGS